MMYVKLLDKQQKARQPKLTGEFDHQGR